jgi:uncharacterized repeat protein (TIGR02543 family)
MKRAGIVLAVLSLTTVLATTTARAATHDTTVVVDSVTTPDSGTTWNVTGHATSAAASCLRSRTISITHDASTYPGTVKTDGDGDFLFTGVPESFVSGGGDLYADAARRVIKKGHKKTVCNEGASAPYPLVVSLGVEIYLSGWGSVSIDGGTPSTQAEQSVLEPIGASVSLSEQPSGGFTFVGWSGDCTGTNSTCNFTIDHDSAVTATFGPT